MKHRTEKNKIHCVHIVQHLAPGGLETLVMEMLKFSPEPGSVLVVSLEGQKTIALRHWGRLAEFESQLLFMNKSGGVSIRHITQLTRLLKQLRPEVVHTHHLGPLFYGGLAARLAGVPNLVHTEHDAWHLNNAKSFHLQSLLFKITQPKVVADARKVARQLQIKFPFVDVNTIHNGVDCQRFVAGDRIDARHNFNLPPSAKIIGTAGRLETVKGHEILIQALSRLHEDTHLAIAGSGSQKAALTSLVDRLGLNDRVSFLGLVSNMPLFYQALDVFCLPSRNEGFPLSTLEAQACDIPCVASDVGAVKETLCPLSGEAVLPNQVEILALALSKQLQRQPPSPRDFVTRHFDIRKMVARYCQLATEAYHA
ncbi:glycosyltransferase [Vibrio sp. CAU 1672]|uniref:glycosyltransferase n=1 Tax=Vibrio sp. CAU 1672 TaxID=3032594 RepID=UPI0023DB8386|nr:glycosyltransferase [Vibrio sp. CAU 1672]MDF2152226.1 glycosyltransferase [Vibrio sp. CAU 1672]